MNHIRQRFVLLLQAGVAAAVASCLDPFAPPPDTYSFHPPPVYSTLWEDVEECSGLRGNLGRIRWFGVPQTPFPCPDGMCYGGWKEPHNIYIGEMLIHDTATNYFTVRHEMLHDLVGHAGHPPVFSRCGLMRG